MSAEPVGIFPPERCELGRPVLRDRSLHEEFDRLGYVVVDFLTPAEVARLVEGYTEAAESPVGINPPGAYNDTYAEFSVIHSRPEFRREAFDLMTGILTHRANDFLVDYRPLVANFVNKPPGTGVVPAHQNWSVVDEANYQSVSVWVALVDAEVDNGALSFCDGSHRTLRGRRGMWAYQAFSGIEDGLIDEFLTPVSVRAGQAVILDDAVLHYSPPNRTDAPRLAIQFVMIPQEANALFFQQVGARGDVLEVDVWEIDERFFFEFWHGNGDARFGRVMSRVDVHAPPFDLEGLRALVGTPGEPEQSRWRGLLDRARSRPAR